MTKRRHSRRFYPDRARSGWTPFPVTGAQKIGSGSLWITPPILDKRPRSAGTACGTRVSWQHGAKKLAGDFAQAPVGTCALRVRTWDPLLVVLGDLQPSHLVAMDLVGTVGQPER